MSLMLVIIGMLLAATGALMAVAVAAASRLELTRWVARRLAGADAAGTLLAHPGDVASVASGLTAIGVTVAAVAAPWALSEAPPGSTLLLELGVGLPLLLLLVYFLPRGVGRRWPEVLVRRLVPSFRGAAALVGRVVRGRAATEREELAALFRDSASTGLAREDELEIVTGVMAFADRIVREVMTPRTRIVAARDTSTADELAAIVEQSGYTRIPLYRSSLDDVVGMVHAFDLIKAGPQGAPQRRPVSVIPASRRCADALLDLKRERRHLAIVIDEFGGTAGLVTMEDLLEELVGEIFDELDERTAGGSSGPGVLVVDAAHPLAAVAEHFGAELSAPARVETAGGYMAWAAGRIPQPGERVVAGGLEWDVVEGTTARVGRIVVRQAGRGAASPDPLSGLKP